MLVRSIIVSFFLFALVKTSYAVSPSPQTDQELWVTFGSDIAPFLNEKFGARIESFKSFDEITVARVEEDMIPWMSLLIHREFQRCGGFIVHDDFTSAQESLLDYSSRDFAKSAIFVDYDIRQRRLVERGFEKLQEERITQFIKTFSEFHNRYYTSETGVQAMHWLKNEWEQIVAHRSDVDVYFWEHDNWPQPSVILRFEGAVNPQEKIVVGGHADSIAGWFGQSRSRAPGADDNASGIGTTTEIIRAISEMNFRPARTLYFMAYAAEEVGLRGSREIANQMAAEDKQILGVLQLDMTNYNGSDWDIVMMSDFTNSEQNRFLGALLDAYQPEVSWGYDRCGYACSDHASWHQAGFPASMPFESRTRERNPHIHTARDTIERSGGSSHHAMNFARLGLSYVLELSAQD